MFEKTLSDLVRGIRAHRGSEAHFISQCMSEIKKELKGGNVAMKANAISKLTYLQMLGYDISWSAFNIIEIMSSSRFTYKRIGYLAATQSFHDELDVIMLTTNMVKKDMGSPNMYESGLALNGLACFATPDISRDLANDVLTLTSSSKPYLRKRAIVVMYKIFLKFPDALRPAFPRLKQCLEDPDPGVQCAAVSVICELAQKNPKNYLSLAPLLFKLMNSSSNNWMLIKIIKLFGALCPLEPRLGKKLTEPLTSLVHSTSAMSLLYECINTVVLGLPNNNSAMQLCVSKLRLFMEDADQNLKYLGLLAMSNIMQKQPKAVLQVKDIIMDCIEDKDESIRIRALELIMGMSSKKNIMEIVKKLMIHIDTTESTFFRDIVIEKIIVMCSQKGYHHITNFEWYVTVLVEMTRFEGTRHGKLIASQMLDVTIRVKDVRPFSVRQMATIVENTHLFISGDGTSGGISEVLYAAAWIVGEFSEYLKDPQPVMEALLHPRITDLPGHIQAVFVQNIVKLYASILVKAEAEGNSEATEEVGAMLVEKLPVFMQSSDLEVQERACGILQLMKYIVKLQGKGAAVGDELQGLFEGELNPVAPKAQRKVPVPEGLDLDKWINEPDSDTESEPEDLFKDSFFAGATAGVNSHRTLFEEDEAKPKKGKKGGKKGKGKKARRTGLEDDDFREEEYDSDEMKEARERRQQQIESNPYYLSASKSPKTERAEIAEVGTDVTKTVKEIPVTKMELGIPLLIETPTVKDYPKKKKGKKGKKGKKRDDDDLVGFSRPAVDTTAELPEGAMASDEEIETVSSTSNVHKMLDVNLDMPLRDDEVLPVRTHRIVQHVEEEEKPVKKSKKESKKEKKSKRSKKSKELVDEAPIEEETPKKKKKSSKAKANGTANLLNISGEEPALTTTDPIQDEVPVTTTTTTANKDGGADQDDMEFWLSGSDATAKTSTVTTETETPAEKNPPKSKGKKERKSKEEKKKKKSKKDSVGGGATAIPQETSLMDGLVDLEGGTTTTVQQKQVTSFKILGEDECVSMKYDIKANPMYNNQVTLAIVFSNNCSNQLVSLEFNLLDSLNAKLERPMGVPVHSGVPVPFQLPPGSANECQFGLSVQEFHVPQKLRGTLTYMIKATEGTAQDKIDFKLPLPSSAFISPTPLPQDRFAALLGGGGLCDTKSLKLSLNNCPDFLSALNAIVHNLHLGVIEQLGDSASLYGSSIASHHVCILAKAMGDTQIGISAKGSDERLVSSLLDELKTVV